MISVMLLWMALLAFLQLLFRWLKLGGVDWAEPQLRQLVLWLALLGGALAAAQDRHIRIDIVEHYLPDSLKRMLARIVNSASGIAAAYLALISIEFVESERAAGGTLDRILFGYSAPVWWSYLILPVGLALISACFLLKAASSAKREGSA